MAAADNDMFFGLGRRDKTLTGSVKLVVADGVGAVGCEAVLARGALPGRILFGLHPDEQWLIACRFQNALQLLTLAAAHRSTVDNNRVAGFEKLHEHMRCQLCDDPLLGFVGGLVTKKLLPQAVMADDRRIERAREMLGKKRLTASWNTDDKNDMRHLETQ